MNGQNNGTNESQGGKQVTPSVVPTWWEKFTRDNKSQWRLIGFGVAATLVFCIWRGSSLYPSHSNSPHLEVSRTTGSGVSHANATTPAAKPAISKVTGSKASKASHGGVTIMPAKPAPAGKVTDSNALPELYEAIEHLVSGAKQDILSAPHGAPDKFVASVQIFMVCLISLCAYMAYSHCPEWNAPRQRLWKFVGDARGERIAQILITWGCVLAFTISLSEDYLPAVFLMALIAIIAALEHLTTIEEVESSAKRLIELTGEVDIHVGGMEAKFFKASGEMMNFTQNAMAVNRGITEATLATFMHQNAVNLGIIEKTFEETKTKIDTLLNRDQIDDWRPKLYEDYSRATDSVFAVIKLWDTDPRWWKIASHELGINGKAQTPPILDSIWTSYFRERAGNIQTLYGAVQKNESAKFRFVTDLPAHFPREQFENPQTNAQRFGNLLGLAWQLIIFHEASKRHEVAENTATLQQADLGQKSSDAAYVRVSIAQGAPWVHVICRQDADHKGIESKIFFLLQTTNTRAGLVQELTRELRPEDKADAVQSYSRLIHTYFRRGGPAEDYLCSQIQMAALCLSPENQDVPFLHVMGAILDELGIKEWVEEEVHESIRRPPDITDDVIKDLAQGIFTEFLKRQFNKSGQEINEARPLELLEKSL